MSQDKKMQRAHLKSLSASLWVLAAISPMLAGQAHAQDGRQDSRKGVAAVSRAKASSPNATINLVNLLVQQGTLTEEQAQALIKQAEDEAYVSREASRDATAKADEAAKAATAAAAAASPPGTKRVTYVPDVVKKQLREEIKKEVMDKARREHWASPGRYPEWASRIRFYGDVRTRFEADLFPPGNDNISGSAVNFNAINTGSPYDISASNLTFAPTYNVDQDRTRFRLRARLGMEADLSEGFTAGMRLATGDSNSPVAFNQTLGGSGGNFSKYAIWLDRAFIKYQPFAELAVTVGRFDNPFFSPTDLVWHNEIGFDGVAVQAKYEFAPEFTPFIVAGAFPIYNTDFNFPSIKPDKFSSRDKWLFGAQAGFASKFDQDIQFKFGTAYYEFVKVQGQLSSPCFVNTSVDPCDTDITRPSFAQKGNTYMALRDIIPDTGNQNGTENLFQYFGLASRFRNVVVTAQLDLGYFHPIHVVLDGEYVRNVAFDRDAIAPIALGPFAPNTNAYAGGNNGWFARMTVGHKELKELLDWNAHVGYKYLESDAVIDAFTGSDFGLGGTNLKGYIVGGNVALSPSVWTSLRWMSANSIAGSPFAVDVLQVDLNAKF